LNDESNQRKTNQTGDFQMKPFNKITTTAIALVTLAGAAQAETLLIAGSQGVVHELDTVTGEVNFRGICGGPVNSMIVRDGTLYLGDHNGTVYTFDVATNIVTSAFSVPADASAMSWVGDELVVADSGGTVHYIDSTTHAVNSSVEITETDITAIGIDAGGLFVGGFSTVAVRSPLGQNAFSFFAACGSMINSMAFGSDTMFLGGIAFGGAEAGTVYLFDKFEGGIEYSGTHAVDSDATAMINAEGMLYIAGSDGKVHEMDPTTGTIARVFDTGIDIQAMTPESGFVSCPADYDASGDLNFLDVSRFMDLYTTRLIPGDTNGDSSFNFLDISNFLNVYTGGCQ
jgi:outer membrane protein assembly factor BamB